VGEDGRAVAFHVFIEPDARVGLGHDRCERGLSDLKRIDAMLSGTTKPPAGPMRSPLPMVVAKFCPLVLRNDPNQAAKPAATAVLIT